jgi:seipin
VSTTAYLFFYYNYIPPINLSKPLYLQYALGGCPYALTSLEHTALIAQQAYDVEIQLTMPRTPTNLAAGNFMVDLQLLGPYNPLAKPPESLSGRLRNVTVSTTRFSLSVLHHSRRPAMLQYTSPLTSLAQTFLYLPFHILGLRDLDSACLRIPMFEMLSFARGSANIPTHIRLDIQSDSSANTGSALPIPNIPGFGTASVGTPENLHPASLQVYSSKVSFCARFRGLRYVVYNYRVLSFLVFTTLFYMSSVLSMALAWAAISTLLSKDKDSDMMIKREPSQGTSKTEDEEGKRIKQEQEDDTSSIGGLSPSNLSDTPATFPGTSRQPPVQYPGRPSVPLSAGASQQRLRAGEVADDEIEEDDGTRPGEHVGRQWAEEMREQEGRAADSGIGTSMESEFPASGLSRRRSGRSSGSGSRERD